jgi:hypothetical protein
MDYPIAENIPTIAESGYPDLEFVSRTGSWRPAGAHEDRAARLNVCPWNTKDGPILDPSDLAKLRGVPQVVWEYVGPDEDTTI